jgi:hypothetical protein
MRAASLRKFANVYVLDVCPGDGKRNVVLGFTGGCAGVTTDAARVVYDLGPLRVFALGSKNGELFHVELLFRKEWKEAREGEEMLDIRC